MYRFKKIYPLTFIVIILPLFLTTSCFRIKSSNGGGQIPVLAEERRINEADIALPEGYTIEVVAKDLTFPTGIAFDEEGTPYVTEAGYSYGEIWTAPKLLKIAPGGKTTVIATGGKNGPWNGVFYDNGYLYVAEGGTLEGGKILKISKDGEIEVLVEDLPSVGDHHTNGPVVRDGYVYFGIGTATNSAVVGNDNLSFGWLSRKPEFHDIPCHDITVTGANYETENVLTAASGDIATTGAYSPYGKPTTKGQVIPGAIPCTGAILRVPAAGGELELVAWGLRNPYGLAHSPGGALFITENAYDVRGSRPVFGAGDVLWKIQEGSWYGWPDYSAGIKMPGKKGFTAPGEGPIQPLLKNYPQEPPQPTAILGVHSSSTGMDFSRSSQFGHEGQVFIAQFGDMAPQVGKVFSPVGFKVVRVDVSNGVVHDFAVNKGKRNGPATWLEKGGLERPTAVRFDPSGDALYVVDFGIMRMTEKETLPKERTGVLWKITKK